MEPEPKWILTSKTIWGLLIAVLGIILDAGIVADLDALGNEVLAVLPEVAEIVGLALALYGRIVAKQGLRLKRR